MSYPQPDKSEDATMQAIMTALQSCYGSLDNPNYRAVSALLESDPYRPLIEALRFHKIEITETTDLNDDVSIQLLLDQAGDQVGLSLSGVGPFAALLHQNANEQYHWVTRPGDAPTPLALLVVQTVERAGWKLLDRATATRTIPMNLADGAGQATLYQALFTDSDRIP